MLRDKSAKCSAEEDGGQTAVTQVIKSRRMRQVGHVACMEEMRMHTGFLLET
jgi:hypothetical protein